MTAHVSGVGMTRFGKYADRTLSDLSGEAIDEALSDAGLARDDLDLAVVGNSVAGVITGQTSIRGQVVLRDNEVGEIPVVNVENACASASTALHEAKLHVAAGDAEVALALGVEKLYLEDDREKTFRAFGGAMGGNVEEMRQDGDGDEDADDESSDRTVFMDLYASRARSYMDEYGCTEEHFAEVAAKNHVNAATNPKAQYREPLTAEEVLESRTIVPPLTLYMCSPIGDGAAAAVVTREPTDRSVEIAASTLVSGRISEGRPGAADRATARAYEEAEVGPADVDVAEVHDATSPAEIIAYETLGFCGVGEGYELVEAEETHLGGSVPVNTSGGLVSKGHPVGATGLAQVHEVVEQLRGEAGGRQVSDAELGLTHNGGGYQGMDAAAFSVHVLRDRRDG